MGDARRKVQAIAGFERETFLSYVKSDLAFEDPEALVVLMPMSGVESSADVMPAE